MMLSKIMRSFVLGCLCALLLSGCGGMLSPVAAPPISTYTISASAKNIKAVGKKSKATLLVSMPTAAAGFASADMLYVNLPFKLKAFADHRWVAPPAQLLLPLMANALRKTNYFHAVVTPPFSGRSNYVLSSELQVLEQDFIAPQSSVHLVLKAVLLREKDSKVVAAKTFSIRVPAPENNPYGGVVATNKAAIAFTRQLARFVVKNV